jgi:hypothetical protein
MLPGHCNNSNCSSHRPRSKSNWTRTRNTLNRSRNRNGYNSRPNLPSRLPNPPQSYPTLPDFSRRWNVPSFCPSWRRSSPSSRESWPEEVSNSSGCDIGRFRGGCLTENAENKMKINENKKKIKFDKKKNIRTLIKHAERKSKNLVELFFLNINKFLNWTTKIAFL